jgi:hypothetical protein
MSRVKSKQISDFNPAVTWTSATDKEIPNTKDIQNQFIPEDNLIIEKFINQTIASDVGTWSIITSFDVHELTANNITLFINGLKIDEAAVSVVDNGSNTSEITFKQIDYDIDSDDIFEVHYIKDHAIS